ncbi:MAG: hypothetical protein WCQ53_07765 [bacterium]
MKTLSAFKGFLVFTFLIVGTGSVVSCSSNSPARKETLSELRQSSQDVSDLRRWFVLSDLRRSSPGTASFVLSANKLKAYVLFKESVITAMGASKYDMDKKYYSCPRNSTYCSMCINLKNLSLNCGTNDDQSYSPSGAIIADNQKIAVRKMTMVDERKSTEKLIFSGMPAKFIFNTSTNAGEKRVDSAERYKFSKNSESDPEVVCRQNVDSDSVTCNATIALAAL